MSNHSRRGVSLIELLVALLLLELTGVAALLAILTTERVARRAAAGARDDPARWRGYREAEVSLTCADSSAFRGAPLSFPATPARPTLDVVVACGR
jgi:Tfp pilus assembly protein PilX